MILYQISNGITLNANISKRFSKVHYLNYCQIIFPKKGVTFYFRVSLDYAVVLVPVLVIP